MTRAFVFLFLFLIQAPYLMPAQHPMDLRSSENFRRWALGTPITEMTISHNMVAAPPALISALKSRPKKRYGSAM